VPNEEEEEEEEEGIQYNKKPLIFIFNVSINQGIFPDNNNSKNKTHFQKGCWT
jgi:hypothetical protein